MPISRRELMQGIIMSALAASVVPELETTANASAAEGKSIGRIGVEAHPRLYLNATSLQVQKRKFRTDTLWAARLLKQGDSLLKTEFIPETVAEQGGGQQARYGEPAKQITSMGLTLGLLFQLTGESKYAEKLHSAMVHYGQYVRWGGPGLASRNPPWHSELDTGQFCFGFASGYDMIYSYLSPLDRRKIASDMVRLGILPTLNDWILPGTRFQSLDSMGHNWWSVCVANAGVAVLGLLGDDPRCEQWIAQIDSGFVEWFTYSGNTLHNRIETFELDGPSYEGVSYTNYGISSYLHYLLAWKNIFPQRQSTTDNFLKGIAEFFLHTFYPATSGGLPVSFDDYTPVVNASDTILLLLACGIDTEYAHAYLRHSRSDMPDALSFYLESPAPQPLASLPLSKIYPRMGWAMMRNSWRNDATLLAVKSGYTWNHAHADASTFLLMHRGVPLIIDSGTCPYDRPEYTSYYRQSKAHNVVLFDGQGQPADDIFIGTKFRGSISKWFDGLGVRYIGADATGPMARVFTRHYRHFLWVGNVILILDDIAAFEDGRLDWQLHTSGASQRHGESGLLLRNGMASTSFSMLHPSINIEVRQGLVEQHPDEQIPYNVFSAMTANRHQRFIAAIDLEPSSPAQFQIHETTDYIEIVLDQLDARHFIYLNLRSIEGPYNLSSSICIKDWSTDAYLSMFTIDREGQLSGPADMRRFLVIDGSFMRWHSTSVLESCSKCDCLWNQDTHMEVFSRGQKDVSYSIYAAHAPQRISWNGAEIVPSFDSDRKLLFLRSFDMPS